jgi:ATP-dependent Lon protease
MILIQVTHSGGAWLIFCDSCRRLKKMQPQQPGYSSSRAYLELLSDLPWQKASKEHELDLRAAQERLDNDHYGLVKVKQRIIEYLAVRKVVNLLLCLLVNICYSTLSCVSDKSHFNVSITA